MDEQELNEYIKKLTDAGYSVLKKPEDLELFHYQELREERNRNTAINYTVMTIFLGIALFLYNNEHPILGLTSAFIPLIIDRKLTWFNTIRGKEMKDIEERLGFKNLKLGDEYATSGMHRVIYNFLFKDRDWKNAIMQTPIHFYFFIIFILFVLSELSWLSGGWESIKVKICEKSV